MTSPSGSGAVAVELCTASPLSRIPHKRSTLFSSRSHITKGFHLRSTQPSSCGDVEPGLPSIRISAVPNAPKPFHRYRRPIAPNFEQHYSTWQEKDYYAPRPPVRNGRNQVNDRSASLACVGTTRLHLSGHHINHGDTKQSKSTICNYLVYEQDSCRRFEKHWSSRAGRKRPEKVRLCYIFDDPDTSMRKTWPNTWYRHRSVVLPATKHRDDKIDAVSLDILPETETDISIIYLNDSRTNFPCQLPSLTCPHPTPRDISTPDDDVILCRSPSESSSLPSSTSSSEQKESIFMPSPTANPPSVCDQTPVTGGLNEDIVQVYASPSPTELCKTCRQGNRQEPRETGYSMPSPLSPEPVDDSPTMVDIGSDDAEDEDDDEDDDYEDVGENVMDPNVARLRRSPENIFTMSPTSTCRDVCYRAVTDSRYNKWRRQDRDKKGQHSESRKRKKCQARKLSLLEHAGYASEERATSLNINKLPRIGPTNSLMQKNVQRLSQSDGSLANYRYPGLARSSSVEYNAEKFGFKDKCKWLCYEKSPPLCTCKWEAGKTPPFHQRSRNPGNTPNCHPKSKVFKTSQSQGIGSNRNSNVNYVTLVDIARRKLHDTPVHVSTPFRISNFIKGNETTNRLGVNRVRLPHSFQKQSRQSQLILAKQVCKLPSSTVLPNSKGRANTQYDQALRDKLIKSLLQEQKKKTEKTRAELRNILGQKQQRRFGNTSHLLANLNVNFGPSNHDNPLMMKNSRPVKQGLSKQAFITQKRMATCMY